MPPRKSSNDKGKGIAQSPALVDFENSFSSSSPASSDSPISPLKCFVPSQPPTNPKKKCKFDIESSFDMKTNFWSSSNESLFQTLKSKTIVHGHIVYLDFFMMSHCPIKEFFVFQGWEKIFSSPLKIVYKPLVRFFMQLFAPRSLVKSKPQF